jgi:hypothetical protein
MRIVWYPVSAAGRIHTDRVKLALRLIVDEFGIVTRPVGVVGAVVSTAAPPAALNIATVILAVAAFAALRLRVNTMWGSFATTLE